MLGRVPTRGLFSLKSLLREGTLVNRLVPFVWSLVALYTVPGEDPIIALSRLSDGGHLLLEQIVEGEVVVHGVLGECS
jgi:hypothetical protein